jgi:protein-disulfide isomerase
MSAEHPYSFSSVVQTLNNNFALLVVAVLLAVGGFFGGSLWTENKMLKAGTTGTTAAAAAAPAAAAGAAASPQPTTATVNVGHLPPRGDKNAKVAVIEFADLRCPFCEQFFTQTEPQLLKDYVDTGKVQLYFRHYEFLGPASTLAGNAAECANDQGKFWDFYDYMYKNQPPETDTSMYTSDKLTSIATGLGMNGPKFKTCLDATQFSKNLDTDMSEGTAAGVSGTPAFVIGKVGSDGKVSGDLLVGAQPYTAFQASLDKQLQ